MRQKASDDMAITDELPEWIHLTIIGREEGDDDEGDNDGGDGGDGDEDDEDEDDEGGNNRDDDLAELRKSLKQERQLRRKAEREARKASKKKADDEDNKNLEAANQELQAERAKTQRLSEGYLKSSLTQAIESEARRQGFIDPSDALTDDVRQAITFDQDPDDPTDIDIDADTVQDAVKKLANRKKHLIKSNNDDDDSQNPPGTPRNPRRRNRDNGGDEKLDKSKMAELYPGLR